MTGGTEGSLTKLAQPASSQSKTAQTVSGLASSRNTSAPLQPCSARFSAPAVLNTSQNLSHSANLVVARIIGVSFGRASRVWLTPVILRWRPPHPHPEFSPFAPTVADSRRPVSSVDEEAVLRRPERRGRPVGGADLGVEVLDVAVGRLRR